jgi:hypothetical protein
MPAAGDQFAARAAQRSGSVYLLTLLRRAAASEAAIAIFNTVRPVDPKPKPSRSSLWDGGFEIMCKGCDKDVLRPWMSACPNCSSKCSPLQHVWNRVAVLIYNARGQVQGVCFDRRHPLPLGD